MTLSGHKKREIINKKPICVYCKCKERLYLTIDHKRPLAKGGTDELINLQVTCVTCNQLKGDMLHDEFIKYRRCLRGLRDIGKLHLKSGVRLEFQGIKRKND